MGDPILEKLAQDPVFRPLFESLHQRSMEAARKKIEADPKAHKLTKIMDKPMSYRWYPGGKNGKGQKVLFCWTCHCNVAGYYLGWRETYQKNGLVKRDQWSARKVKRRLKELAKRRSDRMQSKAGG